MNQSNASDYMSRGDTKPNSLEQIFKPLSDEIRADIAVMVKQLSTEQTPTEVIAAFNRLMAELHICTESSREALDTKSAFHHDLNAIGKALDAAGLPDGPTVTRVKRAVDSDDILSVTRLVNPDGWVVQLRNKRHFRTYEYEGLASRISEEGMTMMQAIELARKS